MGDFQSVLGDRNWPIAAVRFVDETADGLWLVHCSNSMVRCEVCSVRTQIDQFSGTLIASIGIPQ
jgi:hypothetical protein